jgi:carbon-monoxide dehydrogenase medium subunit
LKLPSINYASPRSVAEAVHLLAKHEGEAQIISGGQSLMPMLAFRLAAPSLLVDLRRVSGLDRIEIEGEAVVLGAKVRWRDIENDSRLATAHPLLAEAVRHVAHYQVRNRGTVGGSLAHADPAAELPAVAVTCGAEIAVVGPNGDRRVKADAFFVGPLLTSLAPSEVIVALRLPAWPPQRRWGFREFARRTGDFALAGAALFYDVDVNGRIANSRVGVFGIDDVPLRLLEVEKVLDGTRPNGAAFAAAVARARDTVTPRTDIHADAEYRRALLATMLERALQDAAERKTGHA